jgi:hypothetical protein
MRHDEDHPEASLLERFARGEASQVEGVKAVRHLLAGCARCAAILSATWNAGGPMERAKRRAGASKGENRARTEPPRTAERPEAAEPAGDGPAASAPVLDPETFESYDGFRETTLAVFSDPEDNRALRRFGALLSDMAWEFAPHWPAVPGGSFRNDVRASIADLRHLQGYLSHLSRQQKATVLTAEETCLGQVCGRLAAGVKGIADTLERELEISEPTQDEP